MQTPKMSETPRVVRNSVLTSLSLLVSTNCALANGAGSFGPHPQFAQPSWHPVNGNLSHPGLVNSFAAPTQFAGHSGHAATSGVSPASFSSWQAAGLPAATLNLPASGSTTLANQGYQLDLSSTTANVALGSKLFNGAQSVTINAGGQYITFRPGAQVTAAEYVAIKEVLSGGQQTIQLSSSGTADGGSFSLNQVVSPKVSLLEIPQSVTAIDYVSNSKGLNIQGDLVNYGSIYEVASRAGISTAGGSISAKDITNESGALISTQLPSALASTITGVVSGTGLSLNASDTFSNAGTISSAGNINLQAGSGNINNSGLVSSTAGNINISAPAHANININAQGGTFQATSGAINVRDASYTGSGNINMVGGNYQSQDLNLYAGTGAITGSVGQVTGALNTSGDAAHFTADTQNLVLGNNCLKGDPTFANTGDIMISGAVMATEDLTIIAGGNIIGNPGATISTANQSSMSATYNPSTDVTLIAGATVTTTSGNTTAVVPGTPIGTGTASVTFTPGSGGGSINLSGVPIDTSSNQPPILGGSFNQPNGGNVTLVAYAGMNANTGNVSVGKINTSSVQGNGGNVTIIAGGNSVISDDIVTGGQGRTTLGFGGNVSIYTQQPATVGAAPVVYNADGSRSSGGFIPSGTATPAASVQLNNIFTGSTLDDSGTTLNMGTSTIGGDVKIVAGNVTVTSGDAINTQALHSGFININAAGAVVTTGATIIAASAGSTQNSGNSGNVTITAASLNAGAISTTGTVQNAAEAGNVYINTTGAASTGNIDAGAGSGAGTIPGDVVINAGGAITVTSTAAAPASAITGRNVLLGGLDGVTVTAPGGAKTTDITASGSVVLTAGSLSQAAVINVAGGITNAGTRPGVIEVINNSPTSASVNLTVGGTIAADGAAFSVNSGSVAVVSSGSILLGNITTTSFANSGGVFISSGSTAKIAITVGTINTSASGQDNVAGNVILISAGTKNATNPANIKHGAVTMTGSTKGVSLFASLNEPDSIPAQINISETITGANAINIRPGGYQATIATATDLKINNPNSTMVAPINIAGGLTIGNVTQVSGADNISIVAGGSITLTQNVQTNQNTSSVVLASLGGIIATSGQSLNIGSQTTAILYAPTSGITLGQTTIVANYDIVVAGTLNTSNAAGNGQSVSLSSAIESISTNDINTFGTGAGATAGSVVLTASNSVSTGDIDASSRTIAPGFNQTGGGAITISSTNEEGSGTGVKTGDINNSGGGLIQISVSGQHDELRTGNITSPFATSIPVTNVSLSSAGVIRTGDITTAATSLGSGSVSIATGFYGGYIGNIDTSSNGNNAGSVSISGGIDNQFVYVSSINASTSGTNQTGSGGSVIVTSASGHFGWGLGGINTSANYSLAGNGTGGSILINASDGVYGYGINASANSNGGSGLGGSVSIAGASIYMAAIDTSASAGNAVGTGGGITLAASSSAGLLQTNGLTTKGTTQGGAIYELSSDSVVNDGLIDTTSQSQGGLVNIVAADVIFTQGINTSASNATAASATGGSVMLAASVMSASTNNIFISNSINTSATSGTGLAQAGSIGIADGDSTVTITNLDAHATTGVGGTAIAGDVFVNSGSSFTLPTSPQNSLGTIDVSASGSSATPGQLYLGATSKEPFTFSSSATANQFANLSSITGPTAQINVLPGVGGVTLTVGAYDNIDTNGNPVNLTLNFGGDGRLLVPIICTGQIFLSGLTADNTVGGAVNDGYGVHLISFAGISISGDITSAPFGGGTQGNIQLVTTQNSIAQSSGTISGNNLNLASFNGVGTSTNPIVTNATTVTANAFGNAFSSASVFITGTGASTSFSGINQASPGSSQFVYTSSLPSSGVAAGAVIYAPNITLTNTNSSGTLQIAGTVAGEGASSTATVQANNVIVNALAQLSAGAMIIETSNITNNGIISTSTGTLAIDNSNATSPDLKVSGSGQFVSPVALSLSALGNVDFGGLINGGVLSLQPGENLVIVAGESITATGANTNFAINSSSTSGNGGSVNMYAGMIYKFPGTSSFNDIEIDSPDVPSNSGGSIILDGSNGGYILNSINTGSSVGKAGDVTLVAEGPSSANNVIFLPISGSIAASGLTGNGTVSIFAFGPSAGGAAITVGNISVGGAGSNSGTGLIDLETNSLDAGAFAFHNGAAGDIPSTPATAMGSGTVTAGTLVTNGGMLLIESASDVNLNIDSTLNGRDIEITSNTGNINIPLLSTIAAVPDSFGNGGTVVVSAPLGNVTWLNSATTPLILTANAAGAGSGSGGSVELDTANTNTLTFGSGGPNNIQMSANSGAAGGAAGDVTVHTGGQLVLNSQFYSAAALGANGNGALLDFEGSTVVVSGGGAVILSANGKGTGNGGQLDIVQSDSTAVIISSSTFQLSATSGTSGGNGGSVLFRTTGDLTVDPAQIKVNPLGKIGAGGIIELDAGTNRDYTPAATPGNLSVTGVLNVAAKGAAQGGQIVLTSNSVNEFVIGAKVSKTVAPPVNGIVGTPVATGKPNGAISVINFNGDVTNVVALTSYSFIDLEAGSASPATSGKVVVAGALGNTSADVVLEAHGTGSVSTMTNSIAITSSTLTLAAGGNITGATVKAVTAPLTVTASELSASASVVNIIDKAAVQLNSVSATTSFALSDTKNISGFSTVTAPTVSITSSGLVGSTGSPLDVNTPSLTVSGAGTFNMSNNSGTVPITINTQAVKSKAFTMSSVTDIDVAGLIGSTSSIITLNATGTANINTTGSGVISAKTLSLNTDQGTIGSAGSVVVNAATLNASTSDGSAGGAINVQESAATATLGKITTADGNIDITTTSAAKVLQTLAIVGKAAGAVITATNGNLTIENDDTTKGSIVIGKGSNISTTGSGGGNVTISIGNVTGPVLPGTAPTGVVYNPTPTPTGPFFFGSNGITVAGTSTKAGAATIAMNVLGPVNLTFDTGALKATAIKVNGNTIALPTTITADPPVLPGTQQNSPAVVSFGSSLANGPINVAMPALVAAPSGLISGTSSNQGAVTIQPTINLANGQTSLPSSSALAASGGGNNLNTNFTAGNLNAITAWSQSTAAASRPASNLLGELANPDWASETELLTGEIPAVVFSDEDMGIHSDHSTVVDLKPVSVTGESSGLLPTAEQVTISAMTAPAAGQPLEGVVSKSVKGHTTNTITSGDAKAVALRHGSVVFAPTNDMVVDTPLGKISVGAKSLVLVTVNRDCVSVYNLDDARTGAVVVKYGGHSISLSPGRQALLTSKTNASFRDVNPAQMIGYRNIREQANIEGIKAFTSEFCVSHALVVVQPLKKMVRSENEHSRKVSGHLLKTMAILMQLNTAGASYQQMMRPRVTAYLP